ncbi:hypothetical protein K501DRAFT_212916 [Backusella circina FSU 941]|nr:hypothetical protein K501DRAFT_212916 [Backusella circina FSU 941]
MTSIIEQQHSFIEEQDDSAFDPEKDDFEEFGNFDQNDDDNFDEFEEAFEEPKTPTSAERFSTLLDNNENTVGNFIDDYLGTLWEETVMTTQPIINKSDDLLSTNCSRELWNKLSRDTIFYNPITGAVGQFQWIRSESNKSYLNALGVTFTNEDKSSNQHHPTPPINAISTNNSNKKRPTHSPKAFNDAEAHTYPRSVSANPLLSEIAMASEEEKASKKEEEQELELDLDIARAYCELTEETVRIFPDVKLHAIVTDLTRLQRQTGEYLESLLDQREQLLMDAETYNDLISCIVGHAQRLREQNAGKDASPAKVSKTKKKNGLSNMMKRRTAAVPSSVSMGGGVVGPMPKKTMSSASIMTTAESRRSL